MESTKKHIRNLVRELQDTWLSNNVDGLGTFYDENVVLLPPGGGDPLVGKKAVIESYIRFLESSKIQHFEITDLQLEVLGTVSLAVMNFNVAYEMHNKTYQESGADIMVLHFSKKNDWSIVWRTQIPQ